MCHEFEIRRAESIDLRFESKSIMMRGYTYMFVRMIIQRAEVE